MSYNEEVANKRIPSGFWTGMLTTKLRDGVWSLNQSD